MARLWGAGLVTGFIATCLPLLVPVIVPFFNTCQQQVSMSGLEAVCDEPPPFTATIFVQIFMAVRFSSAQPSCQPRVYGALSFARRVPQFYVGVLGAYVSAQVPTVGRIIQGVLLAYVYVVVTCDAWLGLVPEEVMEFLEWVLLAAVTGAGILLGSLNVLMPNVMNIIASSSIGIFMSMQIFCVLGCADLEQVPKLGLERFVPTAVPLQDIHGLVLHLRDFGHRNGPRHLGLQHHWLLGKPFPPARCANCAC